MQRQPRFQGSLLPTLRSVGRVGKNPGNEVGATIASHDVLRGSLRVPAFRGTGTRDEPLRTSAWEASATTAM